MKRDSADFFDQSFVTGKVSSVAAQPGTVRVRLHIEMHARDVREFDQRLRDRLNIRQLR